MERFGTTPNSMKRPELRSHSQFDN